MDAKKTPPVENPEIDLATLLNLLVRGTGVVQESLGGFKIKIFHTRAFPWDEVFKQLLYRDFRVYVGRHKADLFIDAQP